MKFKRFDLHGGGKSTKHKKKHIKWLYRAHQARSKSAEAIEKTLYKLFKKSEIQNLVQKPKS